MKRAFLNIIQSFLNGNQRSVKAKKNILASVFLKGLDSVIYLLLVPVTLGYLNSYEYGIWLTLNSILMWINSFDIGLGNGMRNKVAEAIANEDKRLARIYVSTTFVMLILLMVPLIIMGALCEPFINWFDILSTTSAQVPHLDEIIYIAFAIFCLNFIFKFVGNVYLAMQYPAINNLMVVCGHGISLLIIYILTLTTPGSLFWVAVVYSASPLIVYLIAYPITFFKIYPFLKPNVKYFKKSYLKDLFNIGIQFFLLQLSGILIFSFANLLISHMFGPEQVTPYNISYRYFSIMPMTMGVLLAPMWSAATDAYSKGDIEWIKQSMKSIKKVLKFLSVCIFIMIIISKYAYSIWVGEKVEIPFMMSLLMGIYVCILIWSLSYSNILNGLGKLRIQTINTVLGALAFIPLCCFLGEIWNELGILTSMCLINLSGLILNIIQYNKVIQFRAVGIWNK